MKSIYRNTKAKREVLMLYDKQLAKLRITYKDIYVKTSMGRTHVVECGDVTKPPLLVFHGGNATTAYNLKCCEFLFPYFHIYAVDIIGHPGKSAEVCLSPYGQEYGEWTKEVITALGYEKMSCFGSSFGAGVLVKTMCAAPEMVAQSVLLVPAAIHNAATIRNVNRIVPLCMYWSTHDSKWFKKCMMPMALKEENMTEDMLATAKCSIDYVKIRATMPQDEPNKELCKYKNPVLVMAADRDCLFPAKKVIPKVGKVWKQAQTYILRDRGHINELSDTEEKMIIHFLQSHEDEANQDDYQFQKIG